MFFLVELAFFIMAGAFVYGDYKSGFPKIRLLAAKADHLINVKLLKSKDDDKVAQAQKVLNNYAKNIGRLREAVAIIRANYQIAAQKAQEQLKLSDSFHDIEERALRSGDDKTAVEAAMAKIQHEKRAVLFSEHAQSQVGVAKILQEELDGVEAEFEVVNTQTATIKLNADIAAAKKELYQIVSDISADTGLTAKGELERLLSSTEHDKLKQDALLEMAKGSGVSKIKRLVESTEVKEELEKTRARLSLPPAQSEYLEAENSSNPEKKDSDKDSDCK